MKKIFGALLCFLAILIPFDHRYDKLFRHFSLTLIPEGLQIPVWYEKRIYFYPSDILSILLFFLALYVFRIRLRKMVSENGAPWLVALFLFCLASIVASPLSGYPIAYFRLLQLLTPILLFLAVSQCGDQWKRPVLWCFCIGGVFQALLAVGQYFSQQPLGFYILGELRHIHQAGEIPCPNGARWLFDHLFGTFVEGRNLRRASGTFNHSNPLGGFLLVSLFSSFSLFERKPRILSAAISLMIFALILTFSRSALFAGILGGAIFFYKMRPPRLLYWVAGISFAISLILFGEQILQRGGIFNYNGFSEASDTIRMEQNKLALQMIWEHPFLGIGYQQFTYTSNLETMKAVTMVHNSLLLLGAESGLFALFCLVGFFLGFFKGAHGAALAVGAAFCLIANFDFYPFLFQHAKMSLLLMIGLMMAENGLRRQIDAVRSQ